MNDVNLVAVRITQIGAVAAIQVSGARLRRAVVAAAQVVLTRAAACPQHRSERYTIQISK